MNKSVNFSDREIRATYKIDHSGGDLITVVFQPEILWDPEDIDRQAELLFGDINAIYQEHPGTVFDGVVDLSLLGKEAKVSLGARKKYAELMTNKQMGRLAFVGVSQFLKFVINLLIKASQKKDAVKLFDSKEEALAWLKK